MKTFNIFVSIISEISAAHCVRPLNSNQFLARDLAVAFGSYDTSKKVEVGRIFTGIRLIHIHDNWNPATSDFDGDIAVVKLSDLITFNNYIRPVFLGSERISHTRNGIVAVWGYHDDSERISNLPRKFNCRLWVTVNVYEKIVFCLIQYGTKRFVLGRMEQEFARAAVDLDSILLRITFYIYVESCHRQYCNQYGNLFWCSEVF